MSSARGSSLACLVTLWRLPKPGAANDLGSTNRNQKQTDTLRVACWGFKTFHKTHNSNWEFKTGRVISQHQVANAVFDPGALAPLNSVDLSWGGERGNAKPNSEPYEREGCNSLWNARARPRLRSPGILARLGVRDRPGLWSSGTLARPNLQVHREIWSSGALVRPHIRIHPEVQGSGSSTLLCDCVFQSIWAPDVRSSRAQGIPCVRIHLGAWRSRAFVRPCARVHAGLWRSRATELQKSCEPCGSGTLRPKNSGALELV